MSASSTLPPEKSGVYRSPDDVSDLRKRAVESGAAWVEANLAAVRDKAGLMRAIAGAFGFPQWFGQNWDALSDSLQDLAWLPATGYVLHLRNASAARQALGAEWETLLQIARESASFWKNRGRPFIVLVDRADALPTWT